MIIFNPDWVNDNTHHRIRLARIIAASIDEDQSQPEPIKLVDGWLGDLALRNLEGVVGQTGLRWAALEDVYRQALELVKSRSGYALVLLSRLYAERCKDKVKGGVPTNWELVRELIGDADQRIAALDNDNRKKRLESLSNFHHGVIARFIGDYARAIFEHVKAAEKCEAMGDFVGASIERFSEAVDRMHEAISNGTDVAHLHAPLEKAALQVVACCTGDDNTQKTWRYCRAPMHVLQAAIWDLRKLPLSDEEYWVHLITDEFERVDPAQYETYQPIIVSIKAGLALLRGHRVEAYRLANEVETTLLDRARPEARVTARLVLVVLAMDEHLEVIVNEGEYMHQWRNHARRILAGETRQWCTIHADHAPLMKSA